MCKNSRTETICNAFREYLIREEKSRATVEKYLRDVRAFFVFSEKREITKELILDYKNRLLEKGYAVSSMNSMLASINCLLDFIGRPECKVKNFKVQKQIYCAEEKELTKSEYLRLLEVSKDQPQLCLVMQTICGTGIRVSELENFTVEAVKRGEISVRCKGKIRTILLPGKLRKRLTAYARRLGIRTGPVFITKNGKPLNRSNILSLIHISEPTRP